MVVVIFNEENKLHRTFFIDNRPYKKFCDVYNKESTEESKNETKEKIEETEQ